MLAVRRTQGKGWAATKLVTALYALAFLGLAFWWRIPISAQQEVESAASSWLASPQSPLDCTEITAGAASLGRVTQGQVEVGADGNLRVSAELWQRLPARRREALMAVASQIRRCLSGDASLGAVIYDVRTNRVLGQADEAGRGR
jgi:hypothetical protein